MIRGKGIARTGLGILLSATLALFTLAMFPREALAAPDFMSVGDAQQAVNTSKYSLAEAQSKLSSISSECTALEGEISEMQAKVDELAKQTLDAQDAMFAGRESLGDAMVYEYRNNSVSAILDVMFGSSDWTSFTKGVDYISSIMDSQAAEVENQKRLKAEFEEASGQLTQQKDEQEAKLGELKLKRDEAQQVVNQVSDEVAANTEKLQELKDQAAAIAQAAQNTTTVTTGETVGGAFGGGNNDGGSGNGNGGGSGESSGGSSSGGSDGGRWTAPMSTSWNSGYATAYDLFGGTTASGEIYNRDTVGVAIDIHTPGYGQLVRGKRGIAISYTTREGKTNTVYARIIDGGNFARYGNSLDLTLAVHQALDPSATNARLWGKRTVTYRLL